MTSLLDATVDPAADFADLYHARWRIEEAFKRIKHRLALEPLSSLTWLAARQDFGAKVVCDNLNALAAHAAAPKPVARPGGQPSPLYKINRSYTFGALKSRFQQWLTGALPVLAELAEVLAQSLKNLVACHPGASILRPDRPKVHRYIAYKSCG